MDAFALFTSAAFGAIGLVAGRALVRPFQTVGQKTRWLLCGSCFGMMAAFFAYRATLGLRYDTWTLESSESDFLAARLAAVLAAGFVMTLAGSASIAYPAVVTFLRTLFEEGWEPASELLYERIDHVVDSLAARPQTGNLIVSGMIVGLLLLCVVIVAV